MKLSELKKLQEDFEKEGRFNEELTPVDLSNTIPLTENYPFIRKGLFKRLDIFFKRLFIINPFIKKQNKLLHSEVKGLENIKGLKNGIITCNHVHVFDCLVIKQAIKPKKAKFVVAEFNVMNTFLGKMMQTEGILPLSNNLKILRKFEEAINYYLDKNQFITIYPEQCMWEMYEKPRPFKIGAFHYAVKYNVPIIPMFITFRSSGQLDENGNEKKYFTLNIMPPLYANKNLSLKEQAKDLMERNYNICKEKYEEFYNKKLTYLYKG